jgi:hypothetical protein
MNPSHIERHINLGLGEPSLLATAQEFALKLTARTPGARMDLIDATPKPCHASPTPAPADEVAHLFHIEKPEHLCLRDGLSQLPE